MTEGLPGMKLDEVLIVNDYMSRVWVDRYIERSGTIASFPAPSINQLFNVQLL
jgi:hypothetical protein